MGIGRSRTNEEHLRPDQRRRAVILLLAAGLAHVAGAASPLAAAGLAAGAEQSARVLRYAT